MRKKFPTEIFILIITSFSPLIPQVLKAIIILTLVLSNLKYLKDINRKTFFILFVFSSIFLINGVQDLGNIDSLTDINILTFYFPLCILLGILIAKKHNMNDYLFNSEKIIFIFAIFSLLGVFTYTFMPFLINLLPTYNYHETFHKTAIIFNVLINESNQIISRNAGFTWEPGAFQILLNIGLYTHLKLYHKNNFLKILVYIVAIITTNSTLGLIIMFITLFMLIRKKLYIFLLLLLTAIIFRDTLVTEIYYHWNNKLFGSLAFEMRSVPLLDSLNVARENLMGLGNTGYDLFYRSFNTPAFDSVGQILLRYGFSLLIVILACLTILIREYLILYIIILLTLFTQDIWYFPFIVPFYFIMIRSKSNYKEV